MPSPDNGGGGRKRKNLPTRFRKIVRDPLGMKCQKNDDTDESESADDTVIFSEKALAYHHRAHIPAPIIVDGTCRGRW